MPRRAPLIVALPSLVLLVLYVGSYLALVEPAGIPVDLILPSGERQSAVLTYEKYHWFDREAKQVFWPLEQIDRKLRPAAWETRLERRKRTRAAPA